MISKNAFTPCVQIRWGDMDAMDHINNAVYFRYLEQARVECLTEVSCEPDTNRDGPVVINAHCTFIRQLKYPGVPALKRCRRSDGGINRGFCRQRAGRKWYG